MQSHVSVVRRQLRRVNFLTWKILDSSSFVKFLLVNNYSKNCQIFGSLSTNEHDCMNAYSNVVIESF